MPRKYSNDDYKQIFVDWYPTLELLSEYKGDKEYITVRCKKHNYVFNTKPNWFKLIGSNIYYQDMAWNDIIPFFVGTWGNIKKQMNPEFRKAKDGLR